MGFCIMHTSQWKPWTLALEDVVGDGMFGRRNGRLWTDEGIEMRTIDVVVSTAPEDVSQVAGDADRLTSGFKGVLTGIINYVD